MTTPHSQRLEAKKKIWTIEGPGWREVYEVMPNGDKVLLFAFSSRKEKHDWTDATAVTRTENMPWTEFCKQYRDNPSYSRP